MLHIIFLHTKKEFMLLLIYHFTATCPIFACVMNQMDADPFSRTRKFQEVLFQTTPTRTPSLHSYNHRNACFT